MKIQAPNGDSVEFPDGTPDNVILDVMRREYGGPQTPPASASAAAPGAGMPEIPGASVPVTTTPGGEYVMQPPPNKGAVQHEAPPVGMSDVGLGYASGLARSAVGMLGIPGNVESLLRQISARSAADTTPPGEPHTLAGGEYPSMQVSPVGAEPAMPTSRDVISGFERNVFPITYEPQSAAGRIARALGEFTPGAIFPLGRAGTIGERVGLNVAAPALASEGAGELARQYAPQAEPAARIAAALLAPAAASRAITPIPAAAHRIAAADLLAGEGVPLTAGQRTGSTRLLYMEGAAREMPFGGARARAIFDQQAEAFTRAALQRIGMDFERGTPDVMAAARQRLNGEFNRILQNDLQLPPLPRPGRPVVDPIRTQFTTRLNAARNEYQEAVPPSARVPFVDNFLTDVADELLQRSISGRTIQGWRSTLNRMANDTQDPYLARFLRSARDTLDDIYGASLPPGEAAAWAQARHQWGGMLEIRAALARATEQAAGGIVQPRALGAADIAANDQAYVEGTGRFSDLASAGMYTMTPPPNSGTPGRMMAARALGVGGSGSVAHLLGAGEPVSVGAALAGYAVPGMLARGLMSRPVQWWLGHQGAPPATVAGSLAAGALATGPAADALPPPRRRSVVDALAGY